MHAALSGVFTDVQEPAQMCKSVHGRAGAGTEIDRRMEKNRDI